MACCKFFSVYFVRSVEDGLEPSQTYDKVNKLLILNIALFSITHTEYEYSFHSIYQN